MTGWFRFGTLRVLDRKGSLQLVPRKLAAENEVGMVKSELILRLAELNPHLYQRDIERIVSTMFDEISTALADGDRVELRGFGAFSVKERAARTARNPRTGVTVSVSDKRVPFFKSGKELRERLNTPSRAEKPPLRDPTD